MVFDENAASSQTTEEKKLMARNFSPGEIDIDFEAYMTSKMGIGNETNCDNYYMNGIYMDNFKFMDLKKSISNRGESAVFAVSTGMNSDRAAKLVLRFLDHRREWIVSSMNLGQVKYRLRETMKFCNSSLIKEGEQDSIGYEASLVVAVYYKDCIVYSTFGAGKLLLKQGKRLKNLTSSTDCMGVTGMLPISVKVIDFYSADRLILCSRGAAETNQIKGMETDIENISQPKEIAEKIIDRAIRGGTHDVTCMAISADIPDGIRRKTIVIAAASLMWILINIIIMIVIS